MFKSRVLRVAVPPSGNPNGGGRRARRVAGALLVGLLTLVAVPSPSEAQLPRETYDRVLILGDSWSAGIGLLSDSVRADTTICRAASSAAFPHGVRLAKEMDAEYTFSACNGSTIARARSQVAVAHRALGGSGEGTLIVLSAGGNDLRSHGGDDWPTVLEDCIRRWFGHCNEDADNHVANFEEIEQDMTGLIESIESRFPDATVRVMGYPELMQVSGSKCHGETKISLQEADFLDANARRLNTHLRDGVEAARWSNARFVESIDAFDGHGVCAYDSSDRWIHGVVNWWAVSVNSFHPKQAGYDAFYELLADSLPYVDLKITGQVSVPNLTIGK